MLTAQIRPEDQYLKVSKTENPSLKTVSGPSGTVRTRVGQEDAAADHNTSLHYRARVRLHFTVADRLPSDFTLVKGLIEFHRPKEFSFEYDRKQKTIALDIDLDDIDRLATFLSALEEWVRKEKQFRHALKMAIEFERRYQLERESVYAILKNASASKITV